MNRFSIFSLGKMPNNETRRNPHMKKIIVFALISILLLSIPTALASTKPSKPSLAKAPDPIVRPSYFTLGGKSQTAWQLPPKDDGLSRYYYDGAKGVAFKQPVTSSSSYALPTSVNTPKVRAIDFKIGPKYSRTTNTATSTLPKQPEAKLTNINSPTLPVPPKVTGEHNFQKLNPTATIIGGKLSPNINFKPSVDLPITSLRPIK